MFVIRSSDGEKIAVFGGTYRGIEVEERSNIWFINIDGQEFARYETESEAHYHLDQVWEEFKHMDKTEWMDFGSEIYVKPND